MLFYYISIKYLTEPRVPLDHESNSTSSNATNTLLKYSIQYGYNIVQDEYFVNI
jgi:hypothetical protein